MYLSIPTEPDIAPSFAFAKALALPGEFSFICVLVLVVICFAVCWLRHVVCIVDGSDFINARDYLRSLSGWWHWWSGAFPTFIIDNANRIAEDKVLLKSFVKFAKECANNGWMRLFVITSEGGANQLMTGTNLGAVLHHCC